MIIKTITLHIPETDKESIRIVRSGQLRQEQAIDLLIRENERLNARIKELEAENERLKRASKKLEMLKELLKEGVE